MKSNRDIVILAAVRTPIGKFQGSLKDISPGELGALVVKASVAAAGVDPLKIDEVIMGSVLTAGSGQNIARQAALWGGLPSSVLAYTVNMVCGSGLMSIIQGLRSIMLGDSRFIVCGGTENMSASPYLLPRTCETNKMGDLHLQDSLLKDGLIDVFNQYHMGIIAENIAAKYHISRKEQDAFAQSSQEKARKAIENNRFQDEILPVEVSSTKQKKVISQDEYPRFDSTLEGLSSLKPAFKESGSVTAGNASGINDGAAALVITSREHANSIGIPPMATIRAWSTAALEPAMMGLAPVPATQKALKHAKLNIQEIDLIECNEAFASQSIAVSRDLKIDFEKLNVNGGAIALGHPIGASGTRITVTLIHEMKKRVSRYGLSTLCIGGGMGAALILENDYE